MKKTGEKIIAVVLIAVLVAPALALPAKNRLRAQTFVPVYDAFLTATVNAQFAVSNLQTLQTAIATGAVTAKEVGYVPGINPLAPDPGRAAALAPTSAKFIARQIANFALRRLTDSIVRWIDSGFQGSPAFITNPGGFFLDIADTVAGEFINSSALGFLCEPFQLEIRAALNYNYRSSFTEVIACRLSDVINNVENFAKFTQPNGFAVGGWDSWHQMTQGDNIYDNYLAAEAELGIRIRGRQNIELLQLNWSGGFLSWQECLDPKDENGKSIPLEKCVNKGPILTPGKVIASGLEKTLGAELSQLELAESFDRILQALLNQLITRALSGVGLAGYSSRVPAGGATLIAKLPPPEPPKDLALKIESSTTIRLSWTPGQGIVEGYRVFRNGSSISQTDEVFYLDTDLNPGTNYTYQVQAFNRDASSKLSEAVSITTPAALPPPTDTPALPPPAGLTI